MTSDGKNLVRSMGGTSAVEFFGVFEDSVLKKTDEPHWHMDKIAERVDFILQTTQILLGAPLSRSEKQGRWRHAQDSACGHRTVPHGVTLRQMNCEVLSVVSLPLPTARPMWRVKAKVLLVVRPPVVREVPFVLLLHGI
jgi:hypothetical protein